MKWHTRLKREKFEYVIDSNFNLLNGEIINNYHASIWQLTIATLKKLQLANSHEPQFMAIIEATLPTLFRARRERIGVAPSSRLRSGVTAVGKLEASKSSPGSSHSPLVRSPSVINSYQYSTGGCRDVASSRLTI